MLVWKGVFLKEYLVFVLLGFPIEFSVGDLFFLFNCKELTKKILTQTQKIIYNFQ